MEIAGLKVAPVGPKSYVRPITLAPVGGAGGVVIGLILICVRPAPAAVLPTVPEGIFRLTRLSAEVTFTVWENTP